MGYLDPTAEAIMKRRLPANFTVDQAAGWVLSVVPCLSARGTQSESDTALVIDHLRYSGHLRDEVIAAVLMKTGYKWTVPMRDQGVAMSLGMLSYQRGQITTQQTSMGPRGKPDKDAIKMRAAALGARYSANAHAPDVQEKAWNDLLALLNQVDDTGSGDDPMPGRGAMEKDLDRLERVRKEILLNAGALGREMTLRLGPLGLHRARGGFVPTPDRPGTPYRPPNLTRPAPRR